MTFLLPMEPELVANPFDDPEFLFQVKWDGIRSLVYTTGPNSRLYNRRGREITRQYPEIAEPAILVPGHTGTLDGELIVLDEQGKPSFPLVLRRDRAQTTLTINHGRRSRPVIFMAFDLLTLDDRSLLNVPLTERLSLLAAHLIPGPFVQMTTSHPANGVAFFAAVQELGLEGMVGKDRSSFYLPGRKHPAWRKVKNYREIVCQVIGFTQKQPGQVTALALGIPHEDDFTYVGKVANGISAKEAINWYQWLSPLRREQPGKQAYIPVTPRFRVRVQFLEWTPEMRLRHPVLITPSGSPSARKNSN